MAPSTKSQGMPDASDPAVGAVTRPNRLDAVRDSAVAAGKLVGVAATAWSESDCEYEPA